MSIWAISFLQAFSVGSAYHRPLRGVGWAGRGAGALKGGQSLGGGMLEPRESSKA